MKYELFAGMRFVYLFATNALRYIFNFMGIFRMWVKIRAQAITRFILILAELRGK